MCVCVRACVRARVRVCVQVEELERAFLERVDSEALDGDHPPMDP